MHHDRAQGSRVFVACVEEVPAERCHARRVWPPTMQLTAVLASRLEKVAIDNGFDRELPLVGNWLTFVSTQCPLQIWLTMSAGGGYYAALSQLHVANALAAQRAPTELKLPLDAAACLETSDIPTLHQLVRRAFQLSRTLPDEPLHEFERQTRLLPKTTEAERLVTQRIGQDIFREALLDYWGGSCAVTGVALTPVLRASHMKPWAHCENDAERLNVFNGLLLVANLDALFDRGLISFEDTGEVLISQSVSDACRKQLQLSADLRLRWVASCHVPFLSWHREQLFEA
jgi:putative restriction endonuclease